MVPICSWYVLMANIIIMIMQWDMPSEKSLKIKWMFVSLNLAYLGNIVIYGFHEQWPLGWNIWRTLGCNVCLLFGPTFALTINITSNTQMHCVGAAIGPIWLLCPRSCYIQCYVIALATLLCFVLRSFVVLAYKSLFCVGLTALSELSLAMWSVLCAMFVLQKIAITHGIQTIFSYYCITTAL